MATLYLHIPFCKRICSYCDFYKVGAIALLPDVVEGLHREMEQRREYIADRRLTSIYFGGGTSSLLRIVHLPSVKSGIATGAPPFSIDSAASTLTLIHAAAS